MSVNPLSILVTWEMGGGFGHLKRLEPLLGLLLARGHQVVLASKNLAATQRVFPDIPCLQAPRIAAGKSAYPYANTLAEIMSNIGYSSLAQLRTVVTGWYGIEALTKPDVVILDFSPTALIAFQHSDAYKVLIDNGYSHPPNCTPLPFLRPWEETYGEMHGVIETRVLQVANDYLREQGLEELPYLAALFKRVDTINLVTLPELDHTGAKKNVRYLGYIGGHEGAPPTWPDVEGKRVYLYLKPFEGLTEFLHALQELKIRVLAVIPGLDDDLINEFESLTNITLTNQLLNVVHIAKLADYAICAAGDTLGAMLQHGVPVCAVSYSAEQYLTAFRADKAGVAVIGNEAGKIPDAKELLLAFQTLRHNPEYKANASALSKKYCALCNDENVTLIVDEIEQHA